MKTFKRIAVIALIVMLMSAMFVPASAVGEIKTITINNADDGHSFEAYQIFGGDLANGILSNLVWGEGVDSATLIAKLQAATGFSAGISFTGCTTPEQVAAVLEADEWDDPDTDKFAKIVAEALNSAGKKTFTKTSSAYTADVPVGYYFIKDTADHAGDSHSYTKYIICLTSDTTVSPKTAVPTMTKFVSHKSDSEFDEALSASVGDFVYFKLTAFLKDRTDDYPEYYIQFVDTLPKGLAYDSIASVKVSGISVETNEYGFDDNVVSASDGTQEVTFTMAQAKTAVRTETGREVLEGDTIEVVFKAMVTKDLVVNTTIGNINTAYMKFSNDPNRPDPSGSLGQTASQHAKVYSYGITIDKIDATNSSTKLPGAKFKIYRNGASGAEYVKADANGIVTGWTTVEGEAAEFTTDANGAFTVKGLGKNTYYLKETLAPAGYNSLKSIPTISFVASFDRNTGTVTGFNGSVVGHGVADLKSVDTPNGIVIVTVKNTIGATLPETGGMGTTVFYIGGLVLVLGAAVLLISRKRKGAEG